MQQFLLLLVVVVAVLATATANDMECTFCTIGLGLLQESELQLKLETKLKDKCSSKHKLEKKLCEEAVEKVIHGVMKKTKPEDLCGKMKFCDGFTQCELFKEWPIKHLPAEPKSWPVERRQLLDIHDFKDIHILKDFFDKIIEKYVLPKKEESKSFALFSQILVALLKEIHDKKDPPATGNDAYDKCGHDVKCKLEAVGAHLPLQDHDGDRFSTKERLRGTHWRGVDCNDVSNDVYPGRKVGSDSLASRDIDHNCNSIVGGNSTGSYEDLFCADSQQRGLIMLGDSATAHFHLPPQYLTADGWNADGAFSDAEDEMDFPQCSWGTGHVSLDQCPFQDEVPGITGPNAISLYSQMRERNRCMHNDYQNIGVNGARMTSSDGLVDAVARQATLDHPVLLWMSLIGNDVCNGHPGTASMTTPETFHDDAMASLNKLDETLPPNSYVVSLALFDGELLYDTMHNQQHPVGVPYMDVYDYMNCMGVSPCMGWLNSNATARTETTERKNELNDVYTNIAATASFKNFKYIYYTGDWPKLFGDYGVQMGIKALPNLIEKSDGFHPSQAGNALFAQQFFQWLEKTHPEALGPVNPHNAEIDAKFFS